MGVSVKSTVSDKTPSTVIGQFKGKCADSVENNNSMTLDTELWEKLFESQEYKNNLANGFYIGFLGHPEDPGCQEFQNACIVMREGHVDSDGQVYGTFDLIDTPVGRIVKSFIDAGVNFGISVRGAGDVAPDGYVDPDNFTFRGFDLVAFPAYNDAIPTFTELAAATDTKSKTIYSNVCKSISENIGSITATESLNVIQSQFNPKSNQYKVIAERLNELSSSTDLSPMSMDLQKLEAMTQLYLDTNAKLQQVNKDLATITASYQLECKKSLQLQRLLNSTRRIVSSQMATAQTVISDHVDKYKAVCATNAKLNSKIKVLNNQNLKYKHKINVTDNVVKDKDDIIASLKSKVAKTVSDNSKLRESTSNFDSQITELESKVQACQNIIDEYQDEYAKLYSKALGVNLDSVSVTATTTVSELRSMISAGTNTSNISVAPAYTDDIEETVDEDTEMLEDVVNSIDNEYDIVTL